MFRILFKFFQNIAYFRFERFLSMIWNWDKSNFQLCKEVIVLFLVYPLYGMEKEKIVMQRQIYKFKEKNSECEDHPQKICDNLNFTEQFDNKFTARSVWDQIT